MNDEARKHLAIAGLRALYALLIADLVPPSLYAVATDGGKHVKPTPAAIDELCAGLLGGTLVLVDQPSTPPTTRH